MPQNSLQSVLSQIARPEPNSLLANRWLRLGVVPALAAAIIALTFGPAFSLRRYTARQLQRQLLAAEDHEAAALLTRIAEVDDLGLPRVAAALGDERALVAVAARDVLHRQLDRWGMESNQVTTPKVAALAESLAAVTPSLGPNQRSHAADLAERILGWPTDRTQSNTAILIANCEQVLALHQQSLAELQLAPIPAPELDASRIPPPAPKLSADSLDSSGGSSASIGDASAGALARDATGETPARLSIGDSPARTDALTDEPALSGSAVPRGNQTPAPGSSLQAQGGRPAYSPPPEELRAIRRLADVEVMRLLHHKRSGFAVAAIDELKRRGFQTRHLRLAQRMTDPDPSLRLQLAMELPGIPSIDPKPWLNQLMEDEDDKVRSAAVQSLQSIPIETYRERLMRMKARVPKSAPPARR